MWMLDFGFWATPVGHENLASSLVTLDPCPALIKGKLADSCAQNWKGTTVRRKFVCRPPKCFVSAVGHCPNTLFPICCSGA